MSDKPIIYMDGDTVCYSASALGSCDRALVAARLDYEPSPPPSKLAEIFNAGHAAEEWYVKEFPVESAQQEVRLSIPDTNCVVIGHIDGISDNHVVEIKSQSAEQYDTWTEESWKFGLWEKYGWQVSVYMHALALPLMLIRIRKPAAQGEHFEIATHYKQKAPRTLADIYNRVQSIETRAREDTLPDCDIQAWGCPYWTLHDTRPLEPDPDLDLACKLYKDAQLETKAAKAVEDTAREYLLKLLGERTSVATVGGWSVKHTSYETKEYTVKASTRTKLTVSELSL